jgi:hypothetical protein
MWSKFETRFQVCSLRWDGDKFATLIPAAKVVAPDLTKDNQLAVPLIVFLGRHERNVNPEVAAASFDTVK